MTEPEFLEKKTLVPGVLEKKGPKNLVFCVDFFLILLHEVTATQSIKVDPNFFFFFFFREKFCFEVFRIKGANWAQSEVCHVLLKTDTENLSDFFA